MCYTMNTTLTLNPNTLCLFVNKYWEHILSSNLCSKTLDADAAFYTVLFLKSQLAQYFVMKSASINIVESTNKWVSTERTDWLLFFFFFFLRFLFYFIFFIFFIFFFTFIFLKIYWLIDWLLCWVFVSVLGLPVVVASGGYSSSQCAGLSLLWPLMLRSTGSRRAGSVVVAHGPSCSAACGIFPGQGTNPCLLH